MIVAGILLLIGGVGLYIYGSQMNSNIGAQLDSLFSSGRTNPGSVFVIIGIVMGILGIILIIVGIASNSSHNKESDNNSRQHINPQTKKMYCKNCGTELFDDSSFCYKCGNRITANICPYCSSKLVEGAQFCYQCGKQINLNKSNYNCPNCNAELEPDAAFCIKCGKQVNANLVGHEITKNGMTAYKHRPMKFCSMCGKGEDVFEYRIEDIKSGTRYRVFCKDCLDKYMDNGGV